MANKKRLIDADEFAKTIEKTDANVCADYGDGFCEFGYSRSLLRLLLSEAPTVDAVEVVRCKDCKCWNELNGKDSGKPVGYGYCRNPLGIKGIAYEDSFCSYRERRTDG